MGCDSVVLRALPILSHLYRETTKDRIRRSRRAWFPAALTSFVCRAGAVREVAGLPGECQMVTVTGPLAFLWTRLVAKGIVAGLPKQTRRNRSIARCWICAPVSQRETVASPTPNRFANCF